MSPYSYLGSQAAINQTITTMARRSPSYPALSLGEAVERARQFYEREHFNNAPPEIAIEHWEFSPNGSTGLRCLAAVLHYGLLEDEGYKQERRVWLSELGKDILLEEEGAPARQRAIQTAALQPKLYAEIWEKWGPNLPSDANIRNYLLRERDFNPKTVDDFLKAFRATVEFANLGKGAVSSDNEDDTEPTARRNDDKGRRHDLFSSPDVGVARPAPNPEGTPMPSASPTPIEGSSPVYSVVTGEGIPIAALQVRVPLNKEEYELLEMELDHRLNMLAKMLGLKRQDKKSSEG